MRVLIAEDDGVSMLILRRAVSRLGHVCEGARDGEEAWAAFSARPPDVVISDWMMPGVDGLEFCRRIRERDAATYTYFIFTTSLSDKQSFLTGMRAGADDYLTKPIDPDELEARLIVASRVTSLHRRLLEQNGELARLGRLSHEAARTDPLTQVGNRLRLRDDLEAVQGRRCAAALCDVDDFKAFNDRHGHVAGDDALTAVARALGAELRAGDAVYRYGGEEFLVVLPDQTSAGAVVAMDRARAAVERLAIPNVGPPGHRSDPGVVTVSIGVAEIVPADAPPWEAWLKRADHALYRAKELGKNRVCVWSAGDGDGATSSSR